MLIVKKEKMKSNRVKISVVINVLVTVLVLLACIIMFTGFKFMTDIGPKLETTGLGMLRFFTIDSNIFVGIISILFAIEEIKFLKGKIKDVSPLMYKLKFMATTSVTLTFFVVFAYLGPISKGGVKTLLVNSNLFLHLIIPVLSIITFTIFDKEEEFKFKNTFFSVIPTFVYGVFYLINVIVHMEGGKVSPLYDWYYFVYYGVWTAIIVIPLMLIITYVLGLILWHLNKRL